MEETRLKEPENPQPTVLYTQNLKPIRPQLILHPTNPNQIPLTAVADIIGVANAVVVEVGVAGIARFPTLNNTSATHTTTKVFGVPLHLLRSTHRHRHRTSNYRHHTSRSSRLRFPAHRQLLSSPRPHRITISF